MEQGVKKSIYYFNSEGKINLPTTVDLVVERAKELGIKHVVVFTANGEGAFLIKKKFENDDTIKIYAATFPYKQMFLIEEKNGEAVEKFAETSFSHVKERLQAAGISFIQGVMPFHDIIIPGSKDVKIQTINYTLSLVSGGLRLCVQSVLMAVDGGYIEPGNYVIAMSADTAIVARSCSTSWLFHPTQGMEITEIICKPGNFLPQQFSSADA